MAVNLIAFPFQMDGAGNVATLDDESDDYLAGELAMLLLTNIGERELAPDYGITDPSFQTFDEVEFITQVDVYGVPVSIKGIEQQYTSTNSLTVTVNYDTVDDFADDDSTSTDLEEVFYEEGEV